MSLRLKILVAVLVVLYLLPIWLYPLFPSQDGPSHLYNTIIFSDVLWNPKSFFAQFYELNARPFPNWTFTVLASLFYPLLPILTVEKIVLSLYLVSFVLAAFYLLRSISTDKTGLGFGAFLFAYNWSLGMGFYNFCLSIPLALLAIGYWLRHRGVVLLHWRRAGLASALFLALYFSHLVSFGLILLVLAFLFGCFGRKRMRALGEVALTASPALILGVLHVLNQPKTSERLYHAPLDWLAASTLSLRIGPWFHRYESVWLVALWLLLGGLVAQSLARLRDCLPEERAWWLVVAGVLGLSVLLPNNLLGGSSLNERLPIYLGLFLLAALSPRAGMLTARWVKIAFGVFVLTQLVYLHVSFADWNRRLEPFRRAASHIEPNARVLPLIFEENVVDFFVNPYVHAGSYLLASSRSVSPTNYEGYRDYFPVAYRKDAPLAAPREWFKPAEFLARDMARHYDYVLLWKADDAVRSHPALRRFKPVFAEGQLQLLRRQ